MLSKSDKSQRTEITHCFFGQALRMRYGAAAQSNYLISPATRSTIGRGVA